MPARYFDTRALAKRYVREVGSSWVRLSLAQSSPNVVYASVLAQPEVFSALQRKVREGQLAPADAHRLAHRVTGHFGWPAASQGGMHRGAIGDGEAIALSARNGMRRMT